jgi:hypothetical protein
MTKRQAHTLMGLGVAIILTQIFCTAVLVNKMESTQKSARSAEASAVDAMEYSKRLESKTTSADTVGGGNVTDVVGDPPDLTSLTCPQWTRSKDGSRHLIYKTQVAPASPDGH